MTIIIFTILSALYDNGKRFVDHKPRWVFRAVIVTVISYFEQGNFFANMAFNTAIFYGLFDYTLNILEGRNWNYIGSTAKTDLFWRQLGGWIPQLIFKIIFLTITILLKCLIL